MGLPTRISWIFWNGTAADVTGTQVTLKGSADGYVLAVWNEGGYAYAVSVTKKITKDEILRIVEEIVKK